MVIELPGRSCAGTLRSLPVRGLSHSSVAYHRCWQLVGKSTGLTSDAKHETPSVPQNPWNSRDGTSYCVVRLCACTAPLDPSPGECAIFARPFYVDATAQTPSPGIGKALFQLLLTPQGKRLMQSQFGCGLRRTLIDPESLQNYPKRCP
jgi:hypothetical protein